MTLSLVLNASVSASMFLRCVAQLPSCCDASMLSCVHDLIMKYRVSTFAEGPVLSKVRIVALTFVLPSL